jgi:hypothetical protein
MWARKAKRQCFDEDSGVMEEVEYVHLEESWYEILWGGLGGFFLGLMLMVVSIFLTPCSAIRSAYRQARYCDAVVLPGEVRERAHLG